MHNHYRIQPLSNARRVRTLAGSLAVLFIGGAFYAQNVRAEDACGTQKDYLMKSDPVLAPVRPADCARVYDGAPDFAWPQATAQGFVVSVTFPDGRVATAPTATNWLAWEEPLPAGEYTWTVTAVGSPAGTSAARRFTVDSVAGALDASRN